MTRDTDSYQESWIVIRPPVKGSRNALLMIAVVGSSMIPLLALPLLFEAVTASQRSRPLTLHLGSLAFSLAVSAFALVAAMSTALLDRHSDRVLGYDSARDEAILAERWFGRIVSRRRYARSDIERLQIRWQATFTGTATPVSGAGWWMAGMMLTNGQTVHLHGIRGGPEAPPGKWLSRFSRASELVGRPLQVSSLPVGSDEGYPTGHPIQRLVGRVRRQGVRTRSVALLAMLLVALIALAVYSVGRLIR